MPSYRPACRRGAVDVFLISDVIPNFYNRLHGFIELRLEHFQIKRAGIRYVLCFENINFRLHAEHFPEILLRLPQVEHDILHLVELGGQLEKSFLHLAVFDSADRNIGQEKGARQAQKEARQQSNCRHTHADRLGLSVGNH